MLKKEFIEYNKKFWESIRSKNRKKIIIPLLMNYPNEIEYTLRIAKTIQKEEGHQIEIYLENNKYIEYIESYGVDKIIFKKEKKIIELIKYLKFYKLIKMIFIFIRKDINQFSKIEYKDIKIGDLVYDTYIRTGENITLKKDFRCLKIFLRSLLNVEKYYESLNKTEIEYVILRDKLYITHGIFARIATKLGKKTLLFRSSIKMVNLANIYKHLYFPNLTLEQLRAKIKGNDYIKECDKYFLEKFSGKCLDFDAKQAYNDKKNYSKEEILKRLNLDKTKKNIVIMAHAFSDGPHISKSIYEDYYIWLVETLKIIKKLDNVNWIIKEHPTSFWYNEKNIVKEILEKNKIKNVVFYPNEWSTLGIKEIADGIITDKGTAALEFSCFGKLAVITGETYYSDYGFTKNIKNKLEYAEILSKLHKIDLNLSEEQISNAKLIMYYIYIYNKDELEYIKNPIRTKNENVEGIFKEILEENKKNDYKKNRLYKDTLELLYGKKEI